MREVVPCGTCRACCKRERIVLYPERGDVVEDYETLPAATNEALRKFYGDRRMLPHKENGDCIYLGDSGCTIWGRAPVVCKEFDCRRFFLKFSRKDRRELLRKGALDREVLTAGRDRLKSLDDVV